MQSLISQSAPSSLISHWRGGNLKLLRESTNADRKQLKIAFLIANCHFRLRICNLKRCFNAYPSALLDSRDSLWLPPIRCGSGFTLFAQTCLPQNLGSQWYELAHVKMVLTTLANSEGPESTEPFFSLTQYRKQTKGPRSGSAGKQCMWVWRMTNDKKQKSFSQETAHTQSSQVQIPDSIILPSYTIKVNASINRGCANQVKLYKTI